MSGDFERFSAQFRESDEETAERWRKLRAASRCECGGNDRIGKPHAPTCLKARATGAKPLTEEMPS